MATTHDLRKILDGFERTPEARGYDLRLSLAEIVLRQLKRKGWTQRKLAERAGMKGSFITRIVHGDSNCTFDVAGRLLFALGVEAELMERPAALNCAGNARRAVARR